MTALRSLLIIALLAFPATSQAQTAFRPALEGYAFEFPRDHGSHDDFRTEWWYYTGHLRTASGRDLGFELTFFRVGVDRTVAAKPTAWDLRDVGLAHFAITDVRGKKFRYYEKLNRVTPYTAHARAGTLDVRNEGWTATLGTDGVMHLRATGGKDSIDLRLSSLKEPAVHGENGISVKAAGVGYASHYYSLTRLKGAGTVTIDGKSEECTAMAWMDHEFGSAALREEQQGWDWFAIQLDNTTELMLYQIRDARGRADTTSSGSFVLQEGNLIHLTRDQFRITPTGKWKSSRTGAVYPMGWKIDVAPLNLSVELREVLEDQELVTNASTRVTYWEGAVTVSGTFGGTPVRGRGYVEMTGYDRRPEMD